MKNGKQNNFSEKIKNKISNFFIETGLLKIFTSKNSCIIMYHGIDLIENKKYNSRFIGIKNFEKQIIYFKKNYKIVALEDFFNEHLCSDNFTIAITFDDGYQNNFKYALPILEKYKVPANFFITGLNNTESKIIWSDFVDISSSFVPDKAKIEIDGVTFCKKGHRNWYSEENNYSLYDFIKNSFNEKGELTKKIERAFLSKINDFRQYTNLFDYWKLMNDEEIKILSQSPYASIGSHGFYHNNLGNIDHIHAVAEIKQSKLYLEGLIQKNINSIAYPDGSYTRAIIDDAYNLGINNQLAVDYLYPPDLMDKRIINRFGIYPFYSPNKLGYLLTQKSDDGE